MKRKVLAIYFEVFQGSETVLDAGLPTQKKGPAPFELLKDILLNTPHYFLFIITKEQWKKWEEYEAKYSLQEFKHYEMPDFVTNPNHNNGRRLKLIVLRGVGKNDEN